jgi:uncharacterized Zn-finger protein
VCETCGARFTRKSNLLEHLATHSAPAAERRRFVRPIGGSESAFTRKSNLTTHMETFDACVQGNCCQICHKNFQYPCLLARHMQSHMVNEPPIIVELPESALRGDGRSGDGNGKLWDV